jgi:hypothetical protein
MAVEWKKFTFPEDEKHVIVFHVGGTVAAGTRQSARFKLNRAYTGAGVWMDIKVPPTGAALIVDINESGGTVAGTSIFSTKPQINIGDMADSGSAVFSDTSLADDNWL